MIKIEVQKITDPVHLDGKKFLIVPAEKLEALIKSNQAYEADANQLKSVAKKTMSALDLLDEKTGAMHEHFKSGEKSILKHIMKVFGKTSLSMDPMAAIKKKFGFMESELLPILKKYAN